MRTRFLYLGSDWTDYAEIWYVAMGPLGKRFTKVDVKYVRTCSCIRRGTAARVHVCIPYPYIGNGQTNCTEIWCMARRPVAMHFTQDGRICTNAYVTVTH